MTWKAVAPLTPLQSTAASFLATLNLQADFFDPSKPLVVTRAPGRLDVMGGIAEQA